MSTVQPARVLTMTQRELCDVVFIHIYLHTVNGPVMVGHVAVLPGENYGAAVRQYHYLMGISDEAMASRQAIPFIDDDQEGWKKVTIEQLVAANAPASAQDEILNLTQHAATADQAEAGVVEPADKAGIQSCLTFIGIPTAYDIEAKAVALADCARQFGCKKAMIGGAPYLMSALEAALIEAGVTPVYAYSDRVSVEVQNPDGTVSKSMVFKHLGFVEVS